MTDSVSGSADGRIYLAIDLKSFYASVECVERHLDPLTTNLVVADSARTEKTICLAVSPALKAYGIPGRARLFEVIQKVRDANRERLSSAIRQQRLARVNGQYAFPRPPSMPPPSPAIRRWRLPISPLRPGCSFTWITARGFTIST